MADKSQVEESIRQQCRVCIARNPLFLNDDVLADEIAEVIGQQKPETDSYGLHPSK